MGKLFAKLLGIISFVVPFVAVAKTPNVQPSTRNEATKDFTMQSMDALDSENATMRTYLP